MVADRAPVPFPTPPPPMACLPRGASDDLEPARSGAASIQRYTATTVAMDTVVTLVVETAAPARTAQAALQRAEQWFALVEQACSRFDPDSELMRLCARPGETVAVSPLLFEAVAFACAVARQTRGAFDPTIGHQQQVRGFDRNYRSGVRLAAAADGGDRDRPDYRDVEVDSARRTLRLRRPLLLDLGAVAKGLAIDLAARELHGFRRFAVEAGGDLYAGGNGAAPPWQTASASRARRRSCSTSCRSGTPRSAPRPATPARHGEPASTTSWIRAVAIRPVLC